MSSYPDYLYNTLARARKEGQWYAAQADAAALCFDMLALFPDCQAASDLVYELFCDEWCVYDNRVAIQRHIEEWDDRPWQQRRRLAFSYRFMSRWDGKHEAKMERGGPEDVRSILHDGKMELLGAYCLGEEECADYAWTIFSDAIQKTKDPQAVLHWIGWLYADLGFFADAAEALGELCSRFQDDQARRLLAEVVWWRDNAHRIPWIPPAGDGSRYDRMMDFIDPSAPKTKDETARIRLEHQKERVAPYRPSIDSKLANLFRAPETKEPPAPSPVDWSFLDADDGQPGEPADWVKKSVRLLEDLAEADEISRDMIEDMKRRHRWTRNIPPPAVPKRYDPNAAPYNSLEGFDDLDEDRLDEE